MLTERDMELLLFIGLSRYVSTEQLAREFFPSVDRAQKRLRRLLDAALVRVSVLGSAVSNIVSLTRNGMRVVEQQRPEARGRVGLAGAINVSHLAHHLGVVDARLYLVALAEAEGGRLVRFEGGRESLARELNLDEHGIVPDAIAEMIVGNETMLIAVEVDTGTEDGKEIGRKFGKYNAVLTAGAINEVWIAVAGGARRCEFIERIANDSDIGETTRVMPLEHIRTRPVLRPGPRAAGSQGASPDMQAEDGMNV